MNSVLRSGGPTYQCLSMGDKVLLRFSPTVSCPTGVLRWINGFEHVFGSLDWPCCWSRLRLWSARVMCRCAR